MGAVVSTQHIISTSPKSGRSPPSSSRSNPTPATTGTQEIVTRAHSGHFYAHKKNFNRHFKAYSLPVSSPLAPLTSPAKSETSCSTAPSTPPSQERNEPESPPVSPPESVEEQGSFSPDQDLEAEQADHEELPIYQKGSLLGQGAFGQVFLGLNAVTGEFIAVKEVEFSGTLERMHSQIQDLQREIGIMRTLKHPNVVGYIGVERLGHNTLHILMEYVPGGSLSSLVRKFSTLTELIVRVYTKQILQGLQYLHGNNIIHRDIKGANILVDTTGTIKLADFGASKQLSDLKTQVEGPISFKGTPYWMAPEVILEQGHERPADIWSVGCTVIEMLTGKPPWSEFQNQVAAMYHIGATDAMPTFPTDASPDCSDFLRKCLTRDPKGRPTAAELLTHPFVLPPKTRPRASTLPTNPPRPTLILSPASSTLGGAPNEGPPKGLVVSVSSRVDGSSRPRSQTFIPSHRSLLSTPRAEASERPTSAASQKMKKLISPTNDYFTSSSGSSEGEYISSGVDSNSDGDSDGDLFKPKDRRTSFLKDPDLVKLPLDEDFHHHSSHSQNYKPKKKKSARKNESTTPGGGGARDISIYGENDFLRKWTDQHAPNQAIALNHGGDFGRITKNASQPTKQQKKNLSDPHANQTSTKRSLSHESALDLLEEIKDNLKFIVEEDEQAIASPRSHREPETSQKKGSSPTVEKESHFMAIHKIKDSFDDDAPEPLFHQRHAQPPTAPSSVLFASASAAPHQPTPTDSSDSSSHSSAIPHLPPIVTTISPRSRKLAPPTQLVLTPAADAGAPHSQRYFSINDEVEIPSVNSNSNNRKSAAATPQKTSTTLSPSHDLSMLSSPLSLKIRSLSTIAASPSSVLLNAKKPISRSPSPGNRSSTILHPIPSLKNSISIFGVRSEHSSQDHETGGPGWYPKPARLDSSLFLKSNLCTTPSSSAFGSLSPHFPPVEDTALSENDSVNIRGSQDLTMCTARSNSEDQPIKTILPPPPPPPQPEPIKIEAPMATPPSPPFVPSALLTTNTRYSELLSKKLDVLLHRGGPKMTAAEALGASSPRPPAPSSIHSQLAAGAPQITVGGGRAARSPSFLALERQSQEISKFLEKKVHQKVCSGISEEMLRTLEKLALASERIKDKMRQGKFTPPPSVTR